MYNQLCLIRDFKVGQENIEDFETIMFKKFGVKVRYLTEIETLQSLDEDGLPIPYTGGRNDLFFYIHDADIEKFKVARMHLGVRWWEDVLAAPQKGDCYPEAFVNVYPPTW